MININFVLATNIVGFIDEFKKHCTNKSVYKFDFNNYRDVIYYMQKNKEIDFLVTTERILEDITLEEYIKKIKTINNKVKIIYFVEKLTIQDRNILYKYGIFNIIEGVEIDFKILNEIIENNKDIIYKSKPIITNKLVAVFGTSGAGKSVISNFLAEKISKNKKTVLVDLDLQNSCIDLFSSQKENNKNILKILEDLKLCNEKEYAEKNISKDAKLDKIFSNVSIYESQNLLHIKEYEQLYDFLVKKYEYTVIDLTNCILLDQVKYFLLKSTDIVFVINPNYVSIRQATKYLEILTMLWKIPKEKIKIIVNKKTSKSIDFGIIKKFFGEYKILDVILYNDKVEESINSYSDICKNSLNFDKILHNLGLKENKSIKTYFSLRKSYD